MDFFEMYAKGYDGKKADNSICVDAIETSFIGDDGLHYCVNCNTPLQLKKEHKSTIYTLPIPCLCMKEHEAQRKLREKQHEYLQRIPVEFRGVFLNDLTIPVQFVNSYIDNFETKFQPNLVGLHVFGSVGSGKTYACQCIINELAKRGVRVFAMRFTKLIDIVSNFNDFNAKRDLENKIKHSKLIFLDDLGATRQTEFVDEKINDIINFIYELNIPIIITSNVSRTDFYNSLNTDLGRAYSRLIERCVPQKLEERNFRIEKAKVNMTAFADILNGNY